MTKPNDLVTPYAWTQGSDDKTPVINTNTGALTKREYFAALALQGVMANPNAYQDLTFTQMCKLAVEQSDRLIENLNNELPDNKG